MYLRVETQWPCWTIPVTATRCEGTMVVISEENSHSVACSKCGLGTTGRGPLPEQYVGKLVEQGYIRQLSRRPADINALTAFVQREVRHARTPHEMAGDLLEQFEVFYK